MKEFRKKQKRLYKLMRFVTIFGAIFLFVYIGVQPYVAEFNTTIATVCKYICDAIVICVLVVLFLYYSKYAKADSFLTSVENEINDAGYYLTSRNENNISDYSDAVKADLESCGYSINTNVTIDEFEFYLKANKGSELFYVADIINADKNDIIAYLESVINDITVRNLKRKADAVMCVITANADDGAISLSKMITPLGKKEKIKIAIAIVEVTSSRVYFLGNVDTKCKRMIANFVMNCEVPIKEQYICNEKLKFQYELEEHMKDFNITEFKNGNFFAH